MSGVTMAASIAGMFAGVAQYNYARLVQGQSAWSAVCSSLVSAALSFIVVFYAPAILSAATACILNGGMLGGAFVAALLSFSAVDMTSAFATYFRQATSGAYSPGQVIAIVGKMVSIVLTGYLAGISGRYGSDPSFGVMIRSPKGTLEVQANAGNAPQPVYGEQIYRVYGGDSAAGGASWTPVNPGDVADFRIVAGLPSGGASGFNNTGRFVIEGTLCDPSKVVRVRSALSLDGNVGGLREYIIPQWMENGSVIVDNVSGVNPDF